MHTHLKIVFKGRGHGNFDTDLLYACMYAHSNIHKHNYYISVSIF